MSQYDVLVVGSSGTVGSQIVSLLKQKGLKVRSATSKAVGASQKDSVHLNLVTTGEGLKSAFQGVDKAFFISPPGYADQYAILSPLIQEAKRQGLKHVVLMTAMGANAVETSPFRRAEIELEKSGLNYNIIRPNWFFQNFNSFWIQGIQEHDKILLPAGTAKVGFIDARDIAEVAVKLLTSEEFKNKDFDITGPESVNHDGVAKAISEVAGRKITYQEISPDDLRAALLAVGLPQDYTEFLLMILSFLKLGYSAGLTSNVKLLLKKEPRNLKTYTQDYKSAWLTK